MQHPAVLQGIEVLLYFFAGETQPISKCWFRRCPVSKKTKDVESWLLGQDLHEHPELVLMSYRHRQFQSLREAADFSIMVQNCPLTAETHISRFVPQLGI